MRLAWLAMAGLTLMQVHDYVLTQQRYVLLSFMRNTNMAVVFDVHTGDIELRTTPQLPDPPPTGGFTY